MKSKDVVLLAYRKLKQLVYHDKNDLFVRKRLADFECATDFDQRIENVAQVTETKNPRTNEAYKRWLSQIDYRLVPKGELNKSLTRPERTGQLITNVTSATQYEVDRFNYFIDGPIELHLLATLWLMLGGQLMDRHLDKGCFGARLHGQIGKEGERTSHLFQKYHELYSRWRDHGIKKAKHLLTEEKQSVYIIGLDVQEYFYRVRLDYKELGRSIEDCAEETEFETKAYFDQPTRIREGLLRCLEDIGRTYRARISESLKQTHPGLTDKDVGLPIGLCSSPVLANWYLARFDNLVRERVRPAYYGRYVDDILLVIAAEDRPDSDDVGKIIQRVLVKPNLLKAPVDGRYEIEPPGALFLQQEKCILQHFDAKHSIAGLEKFQKKLEENASNFMLLPVEETDSSLGEVAYDLLYDGSVNKFRSVKGIAENRFELAKHLSRQTTTHLFTDEAPDRKIMDEIQQFFKGSNAIKFYDLWERVFTLFVVAGAKKDSQRFARQIKQEIHRLIKIDASDAVDRLKRQLTIHLQFSRELAEALESVDDPSLIFLPDENVNVWRKANLIRHHLVPIPLLNYTNYKGNLITPKNVFGVVLDEHKVRFSPRYVHFDECLMFKDADISSSQESARTIFERFNSHDVLDLEFEAVILGDKGIS